MNRQIHNDALAQLSNWAESDELPNPDAKVTRGPAAAEAGRELLERAGGRPRLGGSPASGRGPSPRRQVRLPDAEDARLESFIQAHAMSSSQVLRAAVSEYLDRHSETV